MTTTTTTHPDCFLQVRFTKCENSALDPAIYTIAISAGASGDLDAATGQNVHNSGVDWIVKRTFTKLQSLHLLMSLQLGQRYGKVPFPDSLFTTAPARMPLLQAWLQEAVALVPYLPETAREKATSLLGARLATQSTSFAHAGPSVSGGSADGVGGAAPIGVVRGASHPDRSDKIVLKIPVGPSNTNVKRVLLPSAGLTVSFSLGHNSVVFFLSLAQPPHPHPITHTLQSLSRSLNQSSSPSTSTHLAQPPHPLHPAHPPTQSLSRSLNPSPSPSTSTHLAQPPSYSVISILTHPSLPSLRPPAQPLRLSGARIRTHTHSPTHSLISRGD
jgi:hypothetical protein